MVSVISHMAVAVVEVLTSWSVFRYWWSQSNSHSCFHIIINFTATNTNQPVSLTHQYHVISDIETWIILWPGDPGHALSAHHRCSLPVMNGVHMSAPHALLPSLHRPRQVALTWAPGPDPSCPPPRGINLFLNTTVGRPLGTGSMLRLIHPVISCCCRWLMLPLSAGWGTRSHMVMKTYAVVDEEADGAAWNRNSRVMMKGLENKDEQYLLEINCPSWGSTDDQTELYWLLWVN